MFRGLEYGIKEHWIKQRDAKIALYIDNYYVKMGENWNVTHCITRLVNLIYSRELRHRQCINFFQDIECEYWDTPYHNHIRWLSLGKVLRRIWGMRDDFVCFWKWKNVYEFLEFNNNEWILDFAFTLDLLRHLNTLKPILQGKKLYAHDMIKSINDFQQKFKLLLKHFLGKGLVNFPTITWWLQKKKV